MNRSRVTILSPITDPKEESQPHTKNNLYKVQYLSLDSSRSVAIYMGWVTHATRESAIHTEAMNMYVGCLRSFRTFAMTRMVRMFPGSAISKDITFTAMINVRTESSVRTWYFVKWHSESIFVDELH